MSQHDGGLRKHRWLLITAAVAGLLVILTALLLPVLIDINSYRGLIQERAEAALGRKVTLGPMSLSVLPRLGIAIQDPEVEGLLRAESLIVGVRLMPLLLSGTIDVRKVVLERPEVTLARDSQGAWNLGLLGASGEAAPPPGDAARETGRSFKLGSLVVKDALLRLRDESGSTGERTLEARLSLAGSIDVNGEEVRAEFDGTVATEGLSVTARGSLSMTASVADFDVVIDRSTIDLPRTRRMAAAWGIDWPLPQGLIESKDLTLGGRAAGRLVDGGLTDLRLTDIVIKKADLRLERSHDGRWNFEALGGAAGEPGGGPHEEEWPSVTARNLRLAEASVSLHDEATGVSAPADLALLDLLLVVDELAPGKPLHMELQAGVEPAGRVEIQGEVPMALVAGRGEATLDLEVSLEGVGLEGLAAYLESLLGLQARGGTVSTRMRLQGDYPQRIEAEGSLALERIRAAVIPEEVTARVEFDISATDSLGKLRIDHLEAQVNDSHVSLKGSIDNSVPGTVVDLEVLPTTVDAKDLRHLLAISGTSIPVEFSSGEPIRLQARVKGDVRGEGALDLSGSLEVSDFTFRHPMMEAPMEQVNGKLALEKDGFQVSGFSGVIGGSDVSGSLSVAGFGAPRVTFDLASRRADFWELLSFLEEGPAGAAPGAVGEGDSGSSGDDYLKKIAARGELTIGEGSFGSLVFTNLKTTLALREKVVSLDPVSMNLYEGTMSGSASMDMSQDPPVYTVSARASGIDTDALLVANLDLKDTLAGALSGEVSLTATGAEREAVLKNARGSGDIRMEDGRVGAVNVLGVLSRASGLLGERSLQEVSDRLARQGTEFSVLGAGLKVGSGAIRSSNLTMESPDLNLAGRGDLDMLAGTIEIEGQIIFSEALSQSMVEEESRAVEYFWDTGLGRVNLPLKLAGPIDAPTPNIDWGTAGRNLVRRRLQEGSGVREKLEKAGLGELLGGKETRPPQRTAEEKKEALELPPPSAGELEIVVTGTEITSGLLPDLTIKGKLRGTAITRAHVVIRDERDRVIHEASLMEKVRKFYATNDPQVPAQMSFRVKVGGKDLILAKGNLMALITLEDAAGHRSTEEVEVKR